MLHPPRAILMTVVCLTLGLSLVACDITIPPSAEPGTRPDTTPGGGTGTGAPGTDTPSPDDDPIDPDYTYDPDETAPFDGDSPGLTDPIDPDYTYDPQAIYLEWVGAEDNILYGPTLAGYPLGSAPTVDILTSAAEFHARFPEAKDAASEDAASGEHSEDMFFSSLADADDDFFARYDLALIRTRGASGSVRYATTVEEGESGALTIRVDARHPGAETMDIVYYAILVPIPRTEGRGTVTVIFTDRDQTETVTAVIPGT